MPNLPIYDLKQLFHKNLKDDFKIKTTTLN